MQVYWPDWLVEYYVRHDPWQHEPIEYVDEHVREDVEHYDARRVRFFIEKAMRGEEFDPIEVDCRWHYNHPGPPEVMDGHHRYVAAVILGLERIPVDFGGVVVVGEWLAGRRKGPPRGLSL